MNNIKRYISGLTLFPIFAVVVIFGLEGGALYANNFNYHSEFSKTT